MCLSRQYRTALLFTIARARMMTPPNALQGSSRRQETAYRIGAIAAALILILSWLSA